MPRAREQPPAAPVRPAWEREGTAYVLGIDGLTLDVIEPMARQGKLPNFARLAAEGCAGPLATISPTNSSLLWTTIATGRHHRDHGIDGFRFRRLFGRELGRDAIRKAKRYGLRLLVKGLERSGIMTAHMYTGQHIRTKTFWDVVSAGGGRVAVVNWWHSWPARPVNGVVVSDRMFHWRTAASGVEVQPDRLLTFPEGLVDEVREMITPPHEVTADDVRRFVNMPDAELRALVESDYVHHEIGGELRYLVALDRSCWRVFEHCLAAGGAPSVAAVYLRGIDIAGHCAFRFMPAADRVAVAEEDRRRYGPVMPEAYRAADERIGRLLGRMSPQDSLIVLSDHGFAYQEKRGVYGHARGEPPGVLYACGPEFRRGGRVEGATVYDFVPTLMRLCGFPPAEDMEGRCLEELLTDEFRAAHPSLAPVPTYGPRQARHDTPPPSGEVDEQVKEHLRALGYLE